MDYFTDPGYDLDEEIEPATSRWWDDDSDDDDFDGGGGTPISLAA